MEPTDPGPTRRMWAAWLLTIVLVIGVLVVMAWAMKTWVIEDSPW